MAELHKNQFRICGFPTLTRGYKAIYSLWQMMKDNPGIRRVCLCLDHDEPGQAAARRIAEKLKEHGIPSEILVPIQKDWNEDLLFSQQEEIRCPTLQL